MIEKINVTGFSSFGYIRKQLGLGISLSKILNSIPIEKGKVFSFVPENTLEVKLNNFEQGGLYPFDKADLSTTNLIPIRNDSKSHLIDEIVNYISENEMHFCIFEDSIKLPVEISSDIEFLNLDNEEVYYLFNVKNTKRKKIEEAFTLSEDYIFLCMLGSVNTFDQITSQSGRITKEFLKLLALNVDSFIVKAYDGESYLLWSR
jgi:hypothetical protein